MLLRVQLTTGYVLSLDVEPSHTVLDIKQMVCDREGVPPLQQKMLYSAQQLANNRTVEELRLQPGTTVQLVLNLRGGAPEGVGRLGPRGTWNARAAGPEAGSEAAGAGSEPGLPKPETRTDSPEEPEVLQQARCVLDGETHWLANAANLAALMFEAIPRINWAGFYFAEGEGDAKHLILGPFAGRVACTRIPFGKGVCGAAALSGETQVVHDVHEFPGHIACDSRSASEIVVPLVRGGRVLGVLDVDSPEVGRFDGERGLFEGLARVYVESCGAVGAIGPTGATGMKGSGGPHHPSSE